MTKERASCNSVDSLQVSSVQFSWCVRCEQAFRRRAVRLRSRSGSRRRGSRDASRVGPARAAHSWPATDCRCSLPAAAYSPALHSPTHSHHHRQGCKSFQSNSSIRRYECVVLYKDISLQTPERPILRQISIFIYPQIQRRQIIITVLYTSRARPPRWSLPVLWRRFEDGLASICILIAAKNQKIRGPIAAKKRQIRGDFAVVIIAIQNSQIRVSVAGLTTKN